MIPVVNTDHRPDRVPAGRCPRQFQTKPISLRAGLIVAIEGGWAMVGRDEDIEVTVIVEIPVRGSATNLGIGKASPDRLCGIIKAL